MPQSSAMRAITMRRWRESCCVQSACWLTATVARLPVGIPDTGHALITFTGLKLYEVYRDAGVPAGVFNLLVGRSLQAEYGQEPQCIMTMPLLEGLDGVNKMSKSLGNYIGINEPAIDIVTKTMKIDDALMWRWIELLSFDISIAEAASLKRNIEAGALNPRDLKLRLARELAMRQDQQSSTDDGRGEEERQVGQTL